MTRRTDEKKSETEGRRKRGSEWYGREPDGEGSHVPLHCMYKCVCVCTLPVHPTYIHIYIYIDI